MTGLIYALSATPALAGRVFLAAFIMVLAARFGAHVPVFSETAQMAFGSTPEWMLSDAMLVVLGILALVEVTADKIPESRRVYLAIEQYAKPVVAFFIADGLLTPEAADAATPFLGISGSAADVVPGVMAGGLTWSLVRARKALFGWLVEADEDDDSGVMGISSWLTDFASVAGVLFLMVFPAIAFVLLLLTLATVALIRVVQAGREKKMQVACASCGNSHSPAAVACPSCGDEVKSSRRLSMFGLAVSSKPVIDVESHVLHLLQWRRCPACATKLPLKALSQPCPACGRCNFATREDALSFLKQVEGKLPKTLIVSALMSLVPILGLVVGVVYYRLGLIAGVKQYIPRLDTYIGRWVVRVINFFVLWLQVIPILGVVTVPVMCLTNYSYYRSRYLKAVHSRFQRAACAGDEQDPCAGG